MDVLVGIFTYIGIATTALVIYLRAESIWLKIKRWRKNNTKIKCLCKPHVYEVEWIFSDDEVQIRCKKCGKVKRMYVDRKSFNEWLGRSK